MIANGITSQKKMPPRITAVKRCFLLYSRFVHLLNPFTKDSPCRRWQYDLLAQPSPGLFSSPCQQPGSPGWPQQSWTFLNLIQLFLKRRWIFSRQGVSPRRFANNDRRLGFLFHCDETSRFFPTVHLSTIFFKRCAIVFTSKHIFLRRGRPKAC